MEEQARRAQENLLSSTAASFTLAVEDPRSSLAGARGVGGDPDDPESTVIHRLTTNARLTVTIDPVGDRTLRDDMERQETPAPDVKTALDDQPSVAYSLTYGGVPAVQVRAVRGVLYVSLDLEQLERLSGEAISLDQFEGPGAPPGIGPVLDAVRAGEWLSLDFFALLDRILQNGSQGSLDSQDPADLSFFNLLQMALKLQDDIDLNIPGGVTLDGGSVALPFSVGLAGAFRALLEVLAEQQEGVVDLEKLERALAGLDAMPASLRSAGSTTIVDGHFTEWSLDIQDFGRVIGGQQARDATDGVRAVIAVDDDVEPIVSPPLADTVQIDVLMDALIGQVPSTAQTPPAS